MLRRSTFGDYCQLATVAVFFSRIISLRQPGQSMKEYVEALCGMRAYTRRSTRSFMEHTPPVQ